MHPQDEIELKGLLYIADDAPLPPEVEQLYLRVKKLRDRRYAGPMSLDLLVMIVVQSGKFKNIRVPAQA